MGPKDTRILIQTHHNLAYKQRLARPAVNWTEHRELSFKIPFASTFTLTSLTSQIFWSLIFQITGVAILKTATQFNLVYLSPPHYNQLAVSVNTLYFFSKPNIHSAEQRAQQIFDQHSTNLLTSVRFLKFFSMLLSKEKAVFFILPEFL